MGGRFTGSAYRPLYKHNDVETFSNMQAPFLELPVTAIVNLIMHRYYEFVNPSIVISHNNN